MPRNETTEPIRRILNLAVMARNEMQGRLGDEAHRKAFDALGAIVATATAALGVYGASGNEPAWQDRDPRYRDSVRRGEY